MADMDIQQLFAVADFNPDPVLFVWKDSSRVHANAAARRRFPDLDRLGTGHPAAVDALKASAESPGEREIKNEWAFEDRVYEQHIVDPGAGVVHVFLRDITKRKRMEVALRESEARFRSVVESANDAIVASDAWGRVIFWNAGAAAMFGYTAAEMLGEKLEALMPERYRSAHRQGLERLALTGEEHVQGRTLQLHGLNKDGREFPIELSIGSWLAGRDRFFTAIIRDTTDRERAFSELQKARAELERRVEERTSELAARTDELARSNAELEQFASIASHDLKEPLHKVLVFGDMLRQHAQGKLDEKGEDYVARMQNAAVRMNRLIDALLQYSKVTTRAKAFESVPLGDVMRDVISDLELRISETGGRVETGPLPIVKADRLQMHLLFQNLIGNALKFHKKDQPPRVTIGARRDGDFEVITVADAGIGFPADQAEAIFKPFQRLHSRSEFEGSGVGLAICAKIVQRHGGSIRAAASPEGGALFSIRLPAMNGNPEGGRP